MGDALHLLHSRGRLRLEPPHWNFFTWHLPVRLCSSIVEYRGHLTHPWSHQQCSLMFWISRYWYVTKTLYHYSKCTCKDDDRHRYLGLRARQMLTKITCDMCKTCWSWRVYLWQGPWGVQNGCNLDVCPLPNGRVCSLCCYDLTVSFFKVLLPTNGKKQDTAQLQLYNCYIHTPTQRNEKKKKKKKIGK